MISQLSPASTVSETSTYQKLIGSLRSPRTPQGQQQQIQQIQLHHSQDKDVVMASPKTGILPSPNRPVFSSDDFIPFSLGDDDTRTNNNSNNINNNINNNNNNNKKRRDRDRLDGSTITSSDSESNNEESEDVTMQQQQQQQAVVNAYQVRPVWVDPSVDVSVLSLGTEIDLINFQLDHFYRWISLSEEETNLREHAIQLVRDIVRAVFPSARVEIFGSHYTKISLPSSDVDLMIYDVPKDETKEPLSRICGEVNNKHEHEFVLIKYIPQAKIPVLKLTTRLGEVKIDMCVATKDEPPNSTRIYSLTENKYISQMPVLRPLVVTLKQYLQQYLLNDTYTGGAGSYMLTLMSISLLQFRENPRSPNFLGAAGASASHFGKSQDLGVILLEFFELYGKLFNYSKYGISLLAHGSYFNKQDRGWLIPYAPHLLSIEDPSDPDNDVGRGSFNMMQVRLVFLQAFVRLTHPETEKTMPNYKVSSLLTRVIDMDPIYLSRRQRSKMLGATLQTKKENKTKDDKSPSHTGHVVMPTIMVGNKNIANQPYPSPTPIEIDDDDDSNDVDVIDLDTPPSSPPSKSLSLSSFPPTSSSIPIPTSNNTSSSTTPPSTTTTNTTNITTEKATTPTKSYSIGISNVIVNNNSRNSNSTSTSPGGHSHSYNPNFTHYNTSFYDKSKPKKGKFRPVQTSNTNTNTNNTSLKSNTNQNTATKKNKKNKYNNKNKNKNTEQQVYKRVTNKNNNTNTDTNNNTAINNTTNINVLNMFSPGKRRKFEIDN